MEISRRSHNTGWNDLMYYRTISVLLHEKSYLFGMLTDNQHSRIKWHCSLDSRLSLFLFTVYSFTVWSLLSTGLPDRSNGSLSGRRYLICSLQDQSSGPDGMLRWTEVHLAIKFNQLASLNIRTHVLLFTSCCSLPYMRFAVRTHLEIVLSC